MILIGLCVKNQTRKIYLITGAAGFIGSSLCLKLANINKVIGIDNLSKDHNYFIKIKRYQLVKNNIFVWGAGTKGLMFLTYIKY